MSLSLDFGSQPDSSQLSETMVDVAAEPTLDVTYQITSGTVAVVGSIYLMEMVFEYFEDGAILDPDHIRPVQSSTRRNLLSASLTSKAFFESAMNVLWRHMDSLDPLLRLVTSLRWLEGAEEYSLSGIIRKEHIQRVPIYAPRMRSIQLGDLSISKIPEVVLAVIVPQLRAFEPLSTLKRLAIASFNCPTNSLLSLGLSNLTTLVFKDVSSSSEVMAATILHNASTDRSTLKSLTAVGSMTVIILDVISQCESLSCLHLEMEHSIIHPHFLKRMSRSMRSLKALTVSFDSSSLLQDSSASPPATRLSPEHVASFAVLEQLSVSGPANITSKFMDCIRSPELREITLKCASGSINDFLASVEKCSLVNDADGKDNLQAVRISYTGGERVVSLSSSLELLSSCECLEVLEVHIPTLIFTSADIRSVFKHDSWFNLQDLRFSYQPYKSEPGDATRKHGFSVNVLVHLADICTNLHTLHIPLDRHTGNNGCFSSVDSSAQALKTFVIERLPRNWDYSISTAISLSHLLDRLYPQLESCVYSHPKGKHRAWWKGVQDMMDMYRMNRGNTSITPPFMRGIYL